MKIKKNFAFLCILAVFGVFHAAACAAGLVFDLEFSEDGTVGDSVGNEQVTVNGAPVYSVFNSIYGETPYLKFAEKNSNTDAYLSVSRDYDSELDEMSIEVWSNAVITGVRGTGRMYAFGDQQSTSPSSEVRFYQNKIFYKAGNTQSGSAIEASTGKLTEESGKWTHYVFTRKRNKNSTEYAVWVNGKKIDTLSATGAASKIIDGSITCIGGGLSGNDGLRGSIAGFKIYSGILSEQDIINHYSEEILNFSEPGDTLLVSEVTPSDGIISNAGGEIELKFNNLIDASTVKNNIVLKNSEGISVDGAVVSVSVNTVTIKYGNISDGEYTVAILEGLKSLNGVFAEAQEIGLQAKTVMIIEEDFEDGVMPKNFTFNNAGTAVVEAGCGVSGGYGLRFTKSEGDNQRISAQTTGVGGSGTVFEVDFCMDAGYNTRLYIMTPGGEAFVYCISESNAYYGVGDHGDDWQLFKSKPAEAGKWYHISVKLTPKAGTTDSLESEITFEGKTYGPYTITGVGDNTKINGIIITGQNTNSDEYLFIDNIKLYSLMSPQILDVNADNAISGGYIDLILNDDINQKSINSDNISVTLDGEEVLWELSQLNNRTARINILRYLPYGKRLDITYNGLINKKNIAQALEKNISFTIEEFYITVDNVKISFDDENLCADITLNNKSDPEAKVFAALVAYDENGRILETVTDIISFSKPDTIKQTLKTNKILKEDIGSAKLYVWYETDEYYMPLNVENAVFENN